MQQEVLSRLQLEDPSTHPHRREAFRLQLPKLQQKVQPEEQFACSLAHAPLRRPKHFGKLRNPLAIP